MSGSHAVMLAGEEPSGAAEAGLHLVDDKQRPVRIAELSGGGEEGGVTQTHPALTLNDLHDHRRRFVAHRSAQLVHVVERHEVEAAEQRLEGVAVLVGGGERTHRAAVESAHRAHEPAPARRVHRELDGRLVRLGARVAEERAGGRSAA